LPAGSVDRLRWAALLHDIGKLRVPTEVLNKPAKLSSREWETIREHPAEGAQLAAALLPWLGEWGRAIVEHHERYDGTGYPYGLIGREISLAGRIVAVADSFEVMTASRAYKRAMTRPAALQELVRASGKQFDADVVRAFLEVSVPRLRWAMGPTSWLVGTPLLGSAPSITAAGVAAQAAVGITTVAVAGAAGVAGLTAPAAATAQLSPQAVGAAVASTTHASVGAKPSAAPQPARRTASKQSATKHGAGPSSTAHPRSSTSPTPRPDHPTQPTAAGPPSKKPKKPPAPPAGTQLPSPPPNQTVSPKTPTPPPTPTNTQPPKKGSPGGPATLSPSPTPTKSGKHGKG
jgi:hypothetical protein